jgi:pimeloyl-ACP methyl ester carboxylesterase
MVRHVTVEKSRAAEPAGSGRTREQSLALDEGLPDLDWTALPNGAERLTIDAPSGALAMIAMGDPAHPRIVLVPGVTGSKEDFLLMLPLLAEAGYRVESFDMAGQYESHVAGPENLTPPQPNYDHPLFVADLLHVLLRSTTPVHVLGYSFAGTVAQLTCAERPDLFASLTLLSCPPEPGQGFRGVKRIGPISRFTNGAVGAALMIWGVKANFTRVPPGRLAFVRARFALTRRSAVADIITLMKRAPDVRDALAARGIPMLVAVGEHDLWPLHLHSSFAERLGARLGVYRTGHSPCETAPHQLVDDLLSLYREAEAR